MFDITTATGRRRYALEVMQVPAHRLAVMSDAEVEDRFFCDASCDEGDEDSLEDLFSIFDDFVASRPYLSE